MGCDQMLDVVANAVANDAHFVKGFAFRIIESPVATLNVRRRHRALLAAAHRDEHRGFVDQVAGEERGGGSRRAQVDADFVHSLDDDGMNVRGGLRASSDGSGFGRVNERIEPGRSHLRTACTVHACKDHVFHDGVLSIDGEALETSDAIGELLGAAWLVVGVRSQGMIRAATVAPSNCATTNALTSTTRMPENVAVAERASVAAGLANEVDAVNQ